MKTNKFKNMKSKDLKTIRKRDQMEVKDKIIKIFSKFKTLSSN